MSTKKAHSTTRLLAVGLLALFGLTAVLFRVSTSRHREVPVTSLSQQSQLSPALLHDEFFASPFLLDQDLVSIFNEMEHRHHEMMNIMFSGLDPDPWFPQLRGSSFGMPRTPSYDIQEDDKAVTVTVNNVPNVKEINIEIIDGNVLHISGGTKDKNSSLQFEKMFALGRHMDSENIQAVMENDGVLKIVTPKKVEEQKVVRKIDVKTEL